MTQLQHTSTPGPRAAGHDTAACGGAARRLARSWLARGSRPSATARGHARGSTLLLGLAALLSLGAAALLAERALAAPEPSVHPVMTQPLADIPGKEALMLEVVYPPGGADPVHRHDAHGFIYVLEGSIVMGVKGGKEVTLRPGQSFYEGPDDVHTVGRNASSTRPAKFVVLLLKNKGVPAFLPLH